MTLDWLGKQVRHFLRGRHTGAGLTPLGGPTPKSCPELEAPMQTSCLCQGAAICSATSQHVPSGSQSQGLSLSLLWSSGQALRFVSIKWMQVISPAGWFRD